MMSAWHGAAEGVWVVFTTNVIGDCKPLQQIALSHGYKTCYNASPHALANMHGKPPTKYAPFVLRTRLAHIHDNSMRYVNLDWPFFLFL
jgi:hypothetical protein